MDSRATAGEVMQYEINDAREFSCFARARRQLGGAPVVRGPLASLPNPQPRLGSPLRRVLFVNGGRQWHMGLPPGAPISNFGRKET